jgi:hypothetical protein
MLPVERWQVEVGETQIRWAGEADAAAVVAVWSEVSAWLESIKSRLGVRLLNRIILPLSTI